MNTAFLYSLPRPGALPLRLILTFIAAIAVSGGANNVVLAVENAAYAPLLPPPGNPVVENSWGPGVVAVQSASPTPAAAPNVFPAPKPAELTLEQRMDALERTLRQQTTRPAAAELPPAASATTACGDQCTRLDPIAKPTYTIHGRIPFDIVSYDDDSGTKGFFRTDRDNEIGFRSLRLGVDGYIYENLYYTLELEIHGTNNAIAYRDVFVEQQNLPWVGHFRVGHFFEPLRMEDFSGDRWLTFMERAPATQAFAPNRNYGAMFWNTLDDCQDTSWFLGAFRADSPDSPTNSGEWRSDNNDWSYDARAAWLPYYDEPSNGRYLVHIGASYSYRHIGGLTSGTTYNQNVAYNTLNGLAEFSNRSWVGAQGPIGYGAEANSDQWNQVDGEFLTIWGPISVQSEYYQLFMNSGEHYQGGYAFLSYFLTGDNRGYRKEPKTIRGVTPLDPFFWVDTCRGHACRWGAWELDIGYSWVDLTDGHDIVANTPTTAADRRRAFDNVFVAGIGWWQNSWSHVYFDYEHEIVNFVDAGVPNSNANIYGVRWQVDW